MRTGRYKMGLKAGIAGCVLLFLFSAAAVAVPSAPKTPEVAVPNVPSLPVSVVEDKIFWHNDMDTAFALATAEHKPVLVLFTSPDCAWCTKLKSEVFTDKEVMSFLQHYRLVEVDILKNEEKAEQYMVRGVPTLLIFSSDGQIIDGVSGYVNSNVLTEMLKKSLNPEFLKKIDASYIDILDKLSANKLPPEKWPEVMVILGSREKRKELHDRIMMLSPFPKKDLFNLLDNRSLAVRLGALDILEELAGDTFGFDPWLAPEADANAKAKEKWKSWSEDKSQDIKIHSALNSEQTTSYIRDLMSDDREISSRALRMLENGGRDVYSYLADFIKKHPDLPEGKKKKIKVAQYSVIIPGSCGAEPTSIASGLVFGTEDVKMKNISRLQYGGKKVMIILKDFLYDSDSLIREAAVDAIAVAGGKSAVQIYSEFLPREKDVNVIYAVIRDLGNIRSVQGVDILTSYLSSQNEDIVIAALNSITKLKSKKPEAEIAKCLEDRRWRVKVAALDTVAGLSIKGLEEKIMTLLEDKDEFVRMSAVKAITALSSKNAAKKLEEMFIKDDQLKGPVAAAFCKLDLPFPESFAKALEDKNPDIIIGVLQSMEDCNESELGLVDKYTDSPNKDIAFVAARLLALKGVKHKACRAKLIKLIRTGSPEMASIVLDNIRFERERSSSFDDSSSFSLDDDESSDGTTAKGVDDPTVKDIMDAFAVEKPEQGKAAAEEGTAPAAAPAAPKEKPVTVNDMMDAFGVEPGAQDKKDGEAAAESTADASEGSMGALFQAIESCLDASRSPEIRFRAAVLLAGQGRKNSVAVLLNMLPSCPMSQKIEIAECLENSPSKKESLQIFRELIKDSSENVRYAAVDALSSGNSGPEQMEVIFSELLRNGSPLKAGEIVKKSSSSGFNKRNSGKWIVKILSSSEYDPSIQTLALILLEKTWGTGSEKLAEKFLKSENSWQRRAAFYSLGKCNTTEFKKHLGDISGDSSEHVRVVLPAIFTRSSSNWVMYVDDKQFAPSYSWYSSSSRSRKSMSADIRDEVMKLTFDPSANVRLEAFFCLLSNKESFDIRKFIETVDSLPERESVQNRISDFLRENFKQLGPNFRFLVPYLERSKRMDDQQKDKIYKHFNINPDSIPDEELSVAAAENPQKEIQATFVTAKEDSSQPAASAEIKVVYFTNPGCQDCAKVDNILREIPVIFPTVRIETLNIRKQEAMRFNEALCERFGVPSESRLVSPAIFCGGGYLIKKDIVFDRLCGIIAKSEIVPLGEWYEVKPADLEKAGEKIRGRFSKMNIGLVSIAGLLDGINPCAFATIIFLLAYLQLTKRSPSQIAQVGISFIIGVFIAYFCLGLGLVEIVRNLEVLRSLGKFLNWSLAAFALVIMVLSIRDGILCLQGRLKDISLQLPGFLKAGIHAVIRKGARHSHFVVAAFVVGVVISFLELACTGQVYAPTILYMIQESGYSGKTVVFMAIYNVAFIIPLVIIFISSYSGMKSESLALFMQRHAALVKFCTAILFLIIFLAFVFGDRILPSQENFMKNRMNNTKNP
ncbi:MAG: hypothetical protein A2X48_06575 [Lentisphaerae bacterium GWF2_49_21]|nr:MAG: hypothetical protein A2X48_06575 [Lentisphaerae bacterium GWF2_49_21]